MRKALLALLGVACLTRAAQYNITVNDTASSITYGGSVGDANLCQVANGTLVPGQPGCYNAPSQCTAGVAMGQAKNGSASFSFTGTAIYINSLLIDFSPIYTVTLDGNSVNIDGVRPSDVFVCDTLFAKTGLDPKVNHEVRLSIYDISPNRNTTFSSYNDTYIFSLISFVHTVGSETTSKPVIGPAVGAALGGLLLVLAFAIAVLYRRKRRRARRPINIDLDSGPNIPVSHVHSPPVIHPLSSQIASVPPDNVRATTRVTQNDKPAPVVLTYEVTESQRATTGIPAVSSSVVVPSTRNRSTDHLLVADPSSSAQAALASGRDITPEEARFLHDLYANNVPAADIAAMLRAMRQGREGGSGTLLGPPPEYDAGPR